jgi:outer membrane protein OmpA-like peptidoglycan-associated protein
MARPVLNFADFLIESARMINEGYSFSQAKEILSQYIKKSTKASDGEMSAIRTITPEQIALIEKMAGSVSEDAVKALGDALGNMLNVSLENKKMELDVENTEIAINKLSVTNVVAGQVFCDEIPSTSVKTVTIADNKVALEGLLTAINLYNAEARKDQKYWTQKKEGAELKWNVDKKAGEPLNSYSDNQVFITNVDSKVEWKKSSFSGEVTTVTGDVDSGSSPSSTGLKVNLVLYGIRSVETGKGGSVSVSEIVPVTIKKGGGTTEKSVDIQDNGTLFQKAKFELLEDGKRNIFNAIQSNFTSVTAVEVVGGASKEGDEAFNKKLCLDRANSVAEFLKTLIPGASITASKETNIQPAESTDDLKTWRKVTLKITGTLSAVEPASEVINYVAQSKKISADKYNLYQITLSFYAALDQENK